VADHFAGKPRAWVMYEALISAARGSGPVKAVADETHLTLQSRNHHAFAELSAHSGWLEVRLLLRAPKKFELHAPDELDDRFCKLLHDAYRGH
jgi:hypothetical protein